MLPELVKEHEPVVDGQEPVLVGYLYFEDYTEKLIRKFLKHTFGVELHDLLSEIVHEGGLLHEVHEDVFNLGNNRALDHLMEDFETAIKG